MSKFHIFSVPFFDKHLQHYSILTPVGIFFLNYLDEEEDEDDATRRLLAASSNPLVEEFMPLVMILQAVL